MKVNALETAKNEKTCLVPSKAYRTTKMLKSMYPTLNATMKTKLFQDLENTSGQFFLAKHLGDFLKVQDEGRNLENNALCSLH